MTTGTQVQQGPPENQPATNQDRDYDKLIDTASKQPGDWFSIELARGSSNVHTALLTSVGRRCCQVKVSKGRVYLMFNEEER